MKKRSSFSLLLYLCLALLNIQILSACKDNEAVNKPSPEIEDILLTSDLKIKPTLAQGSENQPGYEISKTIDGITGEYENFYHSTWGQTAFPVRLEYFFSGKEDIDYLIYHTRSGNGNFGEVEVYTATAQEPDYKLYGSFNFRKQNASSCITFKDKLKNVQKIKFLVNSGLNEFVSCDEMEFYQNSPVAGIEALLLNVFTDLTCSELKEEVTDSQMKALPNYFSKLATNLKNKTYDSWEKEFRIRDYSPYSDVETWAEKLMTKQYSNLDNPTGIYANAGDSLIVLVGDTHGHPVSLQAIAATNVSGDYYFLKEGVNKIGIKKTGMLYVMYTANPDEQPIRIHIPPECGTVNGFFDLKEHKTDAKYAELLQKSTYKYFCVRGEKIMFYFHRSKLLEFVPNHILSAIHLWDRITNWQQELMGIDDVRPSQVNNHLMAISPESGYMWASSYQIGFVYTYLNNVLLEENVMAAEDNAWGPAHEIGHIHQQAINWPGSTESSNNLFSNYIIYKLGKYKSRGRGLKQLADARFVRSQGWYNMGDATHQNEDTEIHIRMNWQLWNYYHRCGFKPDFWPTLFKLMREETNRIPESDPGKRQLTFARMASKAAKEDLSDFFELWGFFEPVNTVISQYGNWNYVVTQSMINEAKQFMRQFPKPKHAFQYIEDRKISEFPPTDYRCREIGNVGYYSQFKGSVKIKKNITALVSGQKIQISNGEEAVSFEIRKDEKVIYFSNFFYFEVPASISIQGASLYAVQANGERKLLKKIL